LRFTSGGDCDTVASIMSSAETPLMRLPPAFVDKLRGFAAPGFASSAHKRVALLAICLLWFAAPAQAQVSINSISTTANCDAVTGIGLNGSGAVTIYDGNGTLIAWYSSGSGIFIPFEQPSNNNSWTVSGASSPTMVPGNLAPQCKPPQLTVSGGNFNARIMKGTGRGAPPSGSYTVSNANGSAIYLAATPSFPNGTPFFTLSVLPTLGPDQSSVLTVSLNSAASSLAPGRYTASIDFSNAAALSLVTTRQVQLTVWPSIAHDYNGDGFGDIGWRSDINDLEIWLVKGTSVIGSGGGGPIPASTMVVGQRDFDGDTKTDWLIRDASGNTSIWFLNGAQLASTSSLGNIPTAWTVIATGDFNGDARGDILWRDASGNLAVWLMNGASVTTSAGIGNVPATWSVVGTGDFNGDGATDLLWQDNAGNIAIWLMNGTQVVSATGLGALPLTWQVAGTGDFDGDGNTDLLWRDTGGDTAIWLMSNGAVTSAVAIGNLPATWSVAEVGDYNGDGYSDIFWRDTSGNNAMWFMNGTVVTQAQSLGNVPVNWTVQSANAE
jgi:hypothetical protein